MLHEDFISLHLGLVNKYIYNLFGVSNHMGSAFSGHYTAHVKNANNKWYQLTVNQLSINYQFTSGLYTEGVTINLPRHAYIVLYIQDKTSAAVFIMERLAVNL